MSEKIGNKEAVIFIVTIILNGIVLNSNKLIIESCDSASIINSVYISILAFVLVAFVCLLFKKFPNYCILDVSKFLGGKSLQFIVGAIYIAYLGFITAVLLRKMCDCLQIIFFPMTDIVFIVMLFVIACASIVRLDKGGIFKTTLVVFPVIAGIMALVFIGNIRNFNLENIYPILGNGIDSIFVSGTTNLIAFTGLSYLYFLPGYLANPDKFKKIAFSSVIITGIFLVIITASILLMYNKTLTSSELFPFYMAVRYIEFGTFIQRMDSTFLLVSCIAFICYFAINTTVCTHIFKKITNLSDNKPIIYPYLLYIFAVTVCIRNNPNLDFLENIVFKYLFFAIPIAFTLLILILANCKKLIFKGGNS